MFAEADLKELEHWADAVLASTTVRVDKPPTPELAHMQFRDPVHGQPFFLGEVLFYECAVDIDTTRGYGYALGHHPERALYAAVLDAALNARHPLSAQILAALEGAAAEAGRRRAVDAQLVGRTRVRFEVMEG